MKSSAALQHSPPTAAAVTEPVRSQVPPRSTAQSTAHVSGRSRPAREAFQTTSRLPTNSAAAVAARPGTSNQRRASRATASTASAAESAPTQRAPTALTPPLAAPPSATSQKKSGGFSA